MQNKKIIYMGMPLGWSYYKQCDNLVWILQTYNMYIILPPVQKDRIILDHNHNSFVPLDSWDIAGSCKKVV